MKKVEQILSFLDKILGNAKRVFLQTIHHRIEIEGFDGWHLRTAKALKRYAGIESILINPGNFKEPALRTIEGFPVIFVPYVDLNKLPLHRWGNVSPSWTGLVKEILSWLSEAGFSPSLFVHAPRAFNSLLLLLGLGDPGIPVLLQHHGEKNYYYHFLRSSPENLNIVKTINYYIMHLLDCRIARRSRVVYSINHYDLLYYRKICGAYSRFSTMGVFLEDLKPLRSKCCNEVRRIAFVGTVSRNDVKGSDILIRIYKALGGRKSGYELIIVGPIKDLELYRLGKEIGVRFTGRLPHREVFGVLADSDVYMLTARGDYYWGISGGVAPMEAMALNVPLISPTLRHIPEEDRGKAGIEIPWADRTSFEDLVSRVRKALGDLEGLSIRPRDVASKYFDWRVIVKGYLRDLGI
jgi:glycosyltransferase involved in cell wall biosynthesis